MKPSYILLFMAVLLFSAQLQALSSEKCHPDKIKKALGKCSVLPCSTLCNMLCNPVQLLSSSPECDLKKIQKGLHGCDFLPCSTICSTLCTGQAVENLLLQVPERPQLLKYRHFA
uniref:Bifunctional inhibitor/plant lipid transfer protein/seed storage helical domain-containing protein n=1 Tax=Opuntia streptacantha TaxID=393608 RepID=A0A7C9DL14_OPUST